MHSAFLNALLAMQSPSKAPNPWVAMETFDELNTYLKTIVDERDVSPMSDLADFSSIHYLAYKSKPYTKNEIDFTIEERQQK